MGILIKYNLKHVKFFLMESGFNTNNRKFSVYGNAVKPSIFYYIHYFKKNYICGTSVDISEHYFTTISLKKHNNCFSF